MNSEDRVAVCSRSFSRNQELRSLLLSKYKNVTFNDQGLSLSDKTLIDFLKGHTKAIIALERITDKILSNLEQLKVISKYGVGLDMIDMHALKSHDVRLGWEGGVNKRSVSELALSLIINSLRHIKYANEEVLSNRWRQHIGSQLTNKKVGIIGCGHVGKDLIKLLQPFECEIFVNDILDYPEFFKEYRITTLSLDDLLSVSDIVSIHVPLNDSTKNLINAERLLLMKPTAVLINTARGGLVDEYALRTALVSSALAAAAFDVFSIEPPEDDKLLRLDNFISTPHIGGSSIEAIIAMGQSAIDGLDNNYIPEV